MASEFELSSTSAWFGQINKRIAAYKTATTRAGQGTTAMLNGND